MKLPAWLRRLLEILAALFAADQRAATATLTFTPLAKGAKRITVRGGRHTMDRVKLVAGLDYLPALGDIKNKKGGPAKIDGAPTFTCDKSAIGTIGTATGDPRPEVPDGTAVFSMAADVPPPDADGNPVVATFQSIVDRNLNPDIHDDFAIVTVEVELVANPEDEVAATATLNFGAGLKRP